MFKANLLRSTRSIGAGWESRIVVFKIKNTRSFAEIREKYHIILLQFEIFVIFNIFNYCYYYNFTVCDFVQMFVIVYTGVPSSDGAHILLYVTNYRQIVKLVTMLFW